jgi:uncharacterized protein YfaP (DUF2135 family)
MKHTHDRRGGVPPPILGRGHLAPTMSIMKHVCIFMVVCLVSASVSALTLTSPTGGTLRQKKFTLDVCGFPKLMKMVYNGIPFIAEGNEEKCFTREMLAARGMNTITVANADDVTDTDTISFYADVPPTALKVLLYWDTDDTDLDLHVIEPDKTECYYSNPTTPLGGRLDVDVTTGYGPEIYTMEPLNPGVYEIYIHFYGGQELTEATVVTVVYEGTNREQRQTFKLMLTTSGEDEKIYVGKVEVH